MLLIALKNTLGVNIDVIWKTLKERLSTVKPLIKDALAKMREETKQNQSPNKV